MELFGGKSVLTGPTLSSLSTHEIYFSKKKIIASFWCHEMISTQYTIRNSNRHKIMKNEKREEKDYRESMLLRAGQTHMITQE